MSPKKIISARVVMQDLRAGLSDAELIRNYKVTARALQSIFDKLLEAGLITLSYLDKRSAMLERTVEIDFSTLLESGPESGPITEQERWVWVTADDGNRYMCSESYVKDRKRVTAADLVHCLDVGEAKKVL